MLDYNELISLQKDLSGGALDLRKMVGSKIREIETKETKICGTCGEGIKPELAETYTLLFGPDSFKKKASFCGSDCLEYFFVKLRDLNGKRLRAETD